AKVTEDHQIELGRFSITDRINAIVDLLQRNRRVTFEDLFSGQWSRAELVVTFLALLEMTRLRMTRLLQEAPLQSIYVELAVTEESQPHESVDAESRGA
ncbi:MAG TPA: segregation/condensation protein A, partial [Polyangiaceae bacterium]